MAKISLVAAKYIVHAAIEIDGVVDKPDVIGAIFGQTEGLLGADLELRELQRSGRIGRIEVNVETRAGKTKGLLIVPSSLDKAETAIVGAALEIIQRIGPCNAKIRVEKIEDVRVSKRVLVIERAKELLKSLMDTSMPDSQELADEVAYSVRMMEVTEYGNERLPAGPAIDESDEIIIVEGRADVINLLKHGIKNSIAINGTSIPHSIADLCKKKVVTVFVDGDRGGDLIIQELLSVAEIDFVTKAPDGKEVEELTKKEIHKALRGRVSPEQIKGEIPTRNNGHHEKLSYAKAEQRPHERREERKFERPQERPAFFKKPEALKISPEYKLKFRELLEDLVGTRGAYVLDDRLSILGKVPFSELSSTLKSLRTGVYAIVFDGIIDRDLVKVAERIGTKYIVGMDSKVKQQETKVTLVTISEL